MMNKRVYGVLGIASIMANWNADFSGFPKTISDGTIFGSDKAFKYPMKKLWSDQGEKVLYLKSMKLSKAKGEEVILIPRSLKERYEQIFNVEDLKKCKDTAEILRNLFSAIDVKNFGATFAESSANVSLTGAVQIGQGFNKYEQSVAEEQNILSPFRDASDKKKGTDSGEQEDARNSTLGTKIVSNEAHYFYPFSINPNSYREFVEMGVTEGYTEEDYQAFKKAALCAATSYATNAKVGCENELGLFVETEPDLYLPNLAEYISFEKGAEKNKITIACGEFLEKVGDRILSAELYYNPYTTDIEMDLPLAKRFDIVTMQEV